MRQNDLDTKRHWVISGEEIELTSALRTARGQRFVKVLIKTFYTIAPRLVQSAREIRAAKGCLKVADVARLAIKYNLQLKHCFDFLGDPFLLLKEAKQLREQKGALSTSDVGRLAVKFKLDFEQCYDYLLRYIDSDLDAVFSVDYESLKSGGLKPDKLMQEVLEEMDKEQANV